MLGIALICSGQHITVIVGGTRRFRRTYVPHVLELGALKAGYYPL